MVCFNDNCCATKCLCYWTLNRIKSPKLIDSLIIMWCYELLGSFNPLFSPLIFINWVSCFLYCNFLALFYILCKNGYIMLKSSSKQTSQFPVRTPRAIFTNVCNDVQPVFLKIKWVSLTSTFVCVGRLGVLFGCEMVFVASVQIQASLSDLATVVWVVIWV